MTARDDQTHRFRFQTGVSLIWLTILLASPVHSSVLINEVAFDEPTGSPDWVELFVTGSGPVSINNWTLDDEDAASGKEIKIHLSTPVPAGAYVVVYVDAQGTDDTDFSDNLAVVYTGTATTVSLAATEDELSLYSAGSQSTATLVDFAAWVTDGRYDGVRDQTAAIDAGIWSSGTAVALDDLGKGYSLGRSKDGADSNSVGDWVAFSTPTPGAQNLREAERIEPEPRPEDCRNGRDDDEDGDVDCSDDECSPGEECPVSPADDRTQEQALIPERPIQVDGSRNPFSPDDPDAARRSARITFNVGSPTVTKTIRVVDVRGETVVELMNNDVGLGGSAYSGTASGSVFWDGRNSGGELAPIGIYIVYLEGMDSVTGGQVTEKDIVVLGRRF